MGPTEGSRAKAPAVSAFQRLSEQEAVVLRQSFQYFQAN